MTKAYQSYIARLKCTEAPIGFRFITATTRTVTQNLSVSVSKCLKLLKTARNSDGYKIQHLEDCILIIDTRNRGLSFINNANSPTQLQCRKNVTAWDFSTLYTNIPHKQVKENVNMFINNAFKKRVMNNKEPKPFICSSIKRKIGYFCKNRSKTNPCYDKDELINAISFIINNSYVLYHDKVFRQIIGIPMGTSCAPMLANIYLHIYEYIYREELAKKCDIAGIEIARNLSKMFRYQDDRIIVNDNHLFENHINGIYPGEMVLKGTNVSRNKVTFLDLTVSIYRSKFVYCNYDKRRDFNCEIVNYPDLGGGIPVKSSLGAYVFQLVRFTDVNYNITEFKDEVIRLTSTFVSRGFSKLGLFRKYMQLCTKYLYRWSRCNHDISKFSFYSSIFHFKKG